MDQFLTYGFGKDDDPGNFDAAARTAGAGADEHDEQQDVPGQFGPVVEIGGGITGRGDDGGHLKSRLPEGLLKGGIHMPDIEHDDKDT